jgi:hypothetical protein
MDNQTIEQKEKAQKKDIRETGIINVIGGVVFCVFIVANWSRLMKFCLGAGKEFGSPFVTTIAVCIVLGVIVTGILFIVSGLFTLKTGKRAKGLPSFIPRDETAIPASGVALTLKAGNAALDEKDVAKLKTSFAEKSTDELKTIYSSRDKTEYRREVIEAARQILKERGELI